MKARSFSVQVWLDHEPILPFPEKIVGANAPAWKLATAGSMGKSGLLDYLSITLMSLFQPELLQASLGIPQVRELIWFWTLLTFSRRDHHGSWRVSIREPL